MESDVIARDYDAMDHEGVNTRFVEDLLKLPIDPSSILDVGAGTAQLAVLLCRRCPKARVVCVDLSDPMLLLGRRNVDAAGLSGAIRLEHQDGKALRYEDEAFRCVMSNSTLHHVPQPDLLLAEMTRVLAPDGWLFVRDLARPPDEIRLAQILQLHAGHARESQRTMYEMALRAALRPEEVIDVLRAIGVRGASICMTSDRHWTLTWKKS